MHEQNKIEEAEFFLRAMKAAENDPSTYYKHFSAFLSASRSAIQYAFEEAKLKPGGQDWYNGDVVTRPYMPYFREKRNANIHRRPVPPNTSAHVSLGDFAGSTDIVLIQVQGPDGTLGPLNSTAPSGSQPEQPTTASVVYSYGFDDWPGTEDVETLCESYLDEVRAAVADGVRRGFVTG